MDTHLITLPTLPWSTRHLQTNPIHANAEDLEHVFMFLKGHNPFNHTEPHSDNLIWTVFQETRVGRSGTHHNSQGICIL